MKRLLGGRESCGGSRKAEDRSTDRGRLLLGEKERRKQEENLGMAFREQKRKQWGRGK